MIAFEEKRGARPFRAHMGALMALALAASAGATPLRSFDRMSKAEINALIRQTYHATPDGRERFVKYSERFIGVPYGLYPLGIAPKNGAEDPPIRFDKADCTTMVETLIAMSVAPDLKEAARNMAKVRYQNGRVDIQHKNDYIETDWLPNNIRAGFLDDITQKIMDGRAPVEEKVLRIKRYDPQELNTLNELIAKDPERAIEFRRAADASGKNFDLKKAKLPYVPLRDLGKVAANIPSGAIFSVVRENRPDKAVLVTHQGLIIQKQGKAYVRHLPFEGKGIDVPLLDYFKIYDRAGWKVLGINLAVLAGR